MTVSSNYLDQVVLLVETLPHISEESRFALKGGTAINLFYREVPRVSVDIDLVWLPDANRSDSLRDMGICFDSIVRSINQDDWRTNAKRVLGHKKNNPKIYVTRDDTTIKIEASAVIRGTVRPSQNMFFSNAASKRFGQLSMQVVSFEDVYGGKITAALDRKHPRDLFDIMILYENEKISEKLFNVFMVYVASSPRPMHELLAPTIAVQEDSDDLRFKGMDAWKTPLSKLIDTGYRLHEDIGSRLTGSIAEFLLSLHDAEPDFELIGFPDAVKLPAVRWKQLNLEKLMRMNPRKHAEQRRALEILFK